jgi:hypothetical protein
LDSCQNIREPERTDSYKAPLKARIALSIAGHVLETRSAKTYGLVQPMNLVVQRDGRVRHWVAHPRGGREFPIIRIPTGKRASGGSGVFVFGEIIYQLVVWEPFFKDATFELTEEGEGS